MANFLGGSDDYTPTFTKPRFYLPSWLFFFLTCAYIAALDKLLIIPDFWARKLCHCGCGALMMLVDTRRLSGVAVIWLVALASLFVTWTPLAPDAEPEEFGSWRANVRPLRFGAIYDIGITFYLIIVMQWSALRMPMSALAPVFFTDPISAVVGKHLYPKIPIFPGSSKTVFGSAAAFLSTYILFYFYNDTDGYNRLRQLKKPLNAGDGGAEVVRVVGVKTWYKMAVSGMCCLMEATGGQYDNLMLSVPAIMGWIAYHSLHWGATVTVLRMSSTGEEEEVKQQEGTDDNATVSPRRGGVEIRRRGVEGRNKSSVER